VIDLLTKQVEAKDLCKFNPLDQGRCLHLRPPAQTSELPS
jgi:hypothetical protein